MRALRASSDGLHPRSAQAIRTASADRTTTNPACPFVTAARLLTVNPPSSEGGRTLTPLSIHEPAPPPGRFIHQPRLPTEASTCRSDLGKPSISARRRRSDPLPAQTGPRGPAAATKALVVVQKRQLSRSLSA